MTVSDRDRGVILVNVLVILALTASVVFLMLTSQDRLISRGQLASNAAQAEALARAGELSVLVALRRDMQSAPAEDHYTESWARAVQETVELATGRFTVEVSDANARFDVNRLTAAGLGDIQMLGRMMSALELPAEYATQIAAGISRRGPIASVDGLVDLGIPAGAVTVLRPYLSALPIEGKTNLNTVEPLLLQLLLNNRSATDRLLRTRASKGKLEASDFAQVGTVPPPGTGYTSDVWDVTVTAEVDGTEVRLTSRLVRVRPENVPDVIVVSRRFGPDPAAIPSVPPDLLQAGQ